MGSQFSRIPPPRTFKGAHVTSLRRTITNTWTSFRGPLRPWARFNTYVIIAFATLVWGPVRYLFFAAYGALHGAVIMSIGNAILLKCGYDGYASSAYATVAGVIGGAISYVVFPRYGLKKFERRTHQMKTKATQYPQEDVTPLTTMNVLYDALLWMSHVVSTAAIGGAILWVSREKVQLKDPFKISHAIAAGALGGAIFTPVAALLARVGHEAFIKIHDDAGLRMGEEINTYWESTRMKKTKTIIWQEGSPVSVHEELIAYKPTYRCNKSQQVALVPPQTGV